MVWSLVLVSALVAASAIRLGSRRADQNETELAGIEAREREARLLAEAATALLTSPTGTATDFAPRMERALTDAGARLELCHAPNPRPDEMALPLPIEATTGWLYVERGGAFSREDAERLQQGLLSLIRAAEERGRVAEAALEAEVARRAELTRTTVVHAIAHDLRAPLAAMAGAAERLAAADVDASERTDLARLVCDNTRRLERMVEDLLDLSRIEGSACDPQIDWVDLNATVARAIESVRAERGDFAVRTDLPHDLPLVRGDAEQLHRAFANLIDNAARFSPAGEAVEVRGACANGRITIRVLDKGRGIAPAQQSQVFRPFVRGGDEEGSGLGLAISRGFVEASGGRITLQSRGRDGSAFAVSFPTTSQPSPVS